MSFVYKNLTSVVPIGGIATLTGNSGGAISPTAGNINILGSGAVSVAGSGSTLTITVGATGMTWNEITAASASIAANNGYVTNRATLVTLTLPATAAIGDTYQVVGKGVGLWLIAQNAGQTIHFGALNTTTGAGGSLAAILQYDCVEITCITANTDFVVTSVIGNLTVV